MAIVRNQTYAIKNYNYFLCLQLYVSDMVCSVGKYCTTSIVKPENRICNNIIRTQCTVAY